VLPIAELHAPVQYLWLSYIHSHYGVCPLDPHLWAQAEVEQQLGCPMRRYLSETTEEERLHVKRGTIDLLECNLKMRFVAPGDWIRIKFDLKPVVRQACGEAYLCSMQQAGEPVKMVYFRPMGALCDTSLFTARPVFRLCYNGHE